MLPHNKLKHIKRLKIISIDLHLQYKNIQNIHFPVIFQNLIGPNLREKIRSLAIEQRH